MYIGLTTEQPPIARPPMKRAARKTGQLGGEGRAERGNQVEQGDHAQAFAAALALGERRDKQAAGDGAPDRARDRDAKCARREPEGGGERLRGAGDDRRIEAEEQASQSGDRCGKEQHCVHGPGAFTEG